MTPSNPFRGLFGHGELVSLVRAPAACCCRRRAAPGLPLAALPAPLPPLWRLNAPARALALATVVPPLAALEAGRAFCLGERPALALGLAWVWPEGSCAVSVSLAPARLEMTLRFFELKRSMSSEDGGVGEIDRAATVSLWLSSEMLPP